MQQSHQAKQPNVHSWTFKFAILSLALMVQAAPAVAGTIPLMSRTFSKLPLSMIETVSTIPNLGILICVLLSGVIAKWIGNKKTVMVGLILTLASGIVPVFTSSFPLILASRFVLGIGIGLFNPLIYTFMAYYYSGNELSSMYGYENAVANLGSAALTSLAGLLLKLGWHEAYWIYVVTLLAILMFGLLVPNTQGNQQTSNTELKTNWSVIGYTLYIFLTNISFYIVIVKLATLVEAEHYGNGTTASVLISLMTLFGMIASVAYGRLYKRFKHWILPIAVFGIGLTTLAIGLSKNVWVTAVAISLMGACFVITPYLMMAAQSHGPKGATTVSSGLMIVGMNLGAFLSPIVMDTVASMLGHDSPSFILVLAAILLFIIAAWNTVYDLFFDHHSHA
ncbi:MFS transporter [Levilactobacillus bambusae]|uniref:Major facilitator superfamily (MFS) profile domain-containing protein n=1 Tax=Levilactobacillus bambusae TaxID=2024736 RepID=A0A2V1MWP8_9LACO|nr:MFS transporter [Levilactobacillus bambusae]PWF99510.1 hypothetical protein DCM90_08690 [Levilactobacillus bambusae]